MQTSFELEINKLSTELDALSEKTTKELEEIQRVSNDEICRHPATLDAWDYIFCIALGYGAITVTTNEAIATYLEDIHKAASGASGDYDRAQTVLGRMLYHKGDHIDIVEKNFKNRQGENAYGAFHRLLWGHDVLSVNGDNPFVLMIKQKGLAGILQAFQHLVADTASKQGLPLPGSSYLDFEKENGSISNYLIKISESLSEDAFGNKRGTQEIYSHMFTLRAGDIAGNALIESVSVGYFKLRGIDNAVRICQFKLISYILAFVGHAVIGSARQNGVPYINYSELEGAVRYFLRLYSESWKETLEICRVSELCIEDSKALLDDVDKTERFLIDHNSAEEYTKELERGQDNINKMISLWERQA